MVGRLYKRGRKDRTTASKSVTLGAVAELTLRQARKLADEQVRPINQGILVPQSTMKFQDFVDRYLNPLFFPTLKASTQKRYRRILEHTPLTCFWKIPSLRYRNHRRATLCAAENGKWPQLGICQPLSQFNVEGFRNGKDLGFPLHGQSRGVEFHSPRNGRFAKK